MQSLCRDSPRPGLIRPRSPGPHWCILHGHRTGFGKKEKEEKKGNMTVSLLKSSLLWILFWISSFFSSFIPSFSHISLHPVSLSFKNRQLHSSPRSQWRTGSSQRAWRRLKLWPGWQQRWEKSQMNFKTCLCFGCDQQSQWGLCVLLYEQAQGEREKGAALPLPCAGWLSGGRTGRDLSTSVPRACACPEQRDLREGGNKCAPSAYGPAQLSPILIGGKWEMFSKT